jgi:adenylosuccinate synthase
VAQVRDMDLPDLTKKIRVIDDHQFAKARAIGADAGVIYDAIGNYQSVWEAYQVAKLSKSVLGATNICSENQIKRMVDSSESDIVFEPAQGFFLDAKLGTVPYTTAMTTTMEPVLKYVGDTGCGWPEKNRFVGVMSAHFNRHGGGPFVTETSEIRVAEDDNESSKYLLGGPRYGWLDLVALRHAVETTGQWHKLDHLAISHLDHLSGLDEIKVCTRYKGVDNRLSFSKQYEIAKPVYQIFPGCGDLSGRKRFAELPATATDYIGFIEDYLDVPVGWVAVGPRAEDRFAR